jgi:broad specificity phosphatase PhoE
MFPSATQDSCVTFLVRHGATDNNLAHPPVLQGCGTDLGLSEAGRHQAMCVGRWLSQCALSAVYSSALRRAVQTAEHIAEPHELLVQRVEALHEVDVGRWEGRSWEEIERTEPERHRLFLENAVEHGYPDGENMSQLLERVRPVIEQLMRRHLGQSIAIVGHNVTHRIFVADVLGVPLNLARRISHDNGGVSILRCQANTIRLLTLNANFHLA